MDNKYHLRVGATDGTNDIDNLRITVIVTNVNEPPFPLNFSEGGNIDVVEGTQMVRNLMAKDPEGSNLAFLLTTGASDFEFSDGLSGSKSRKLNTTSAMLQFKAAPTYDKTTSANNIKNVTVSLTDGMKTTAVSFTVTITQHRSIV